MDFDLYVGANEDGADDDSEEYGCKSGQEHTGEPCCMPLAGNKMMRAQMKPLTPNPSTPPGRWKKTEHDEFLRGMELHGKVGRLCPDTL